MCRAESEPKGAATDQEFVERAEFDHSHQEPRKTEAFIPTDEWNVLCGSFFYLKTDSWLLFHAP